MEMAESTAAKKTASTAKKATAAKKPATKAQADKAPAKEEGKKVRVVCIATFSDKRAKNALRRVGDVFEVTESRLEEILAAGAYVERIGV